MFLLNMFQGTLIGVMLKHLYTSIIFCIDNQTHMCYNNSIEKKRRINKMVNQIKEDIKKAMIAKDELTKNTLRLVLGNAQLEAKEKKVDLSDEHIINAVSKELKQSNQALQMLKDNNQTDCKFYEDTVKRIELLQHYMPKQLNEAEIEAEIRKLIAGIDKHNKGLVMKTVMPALKGKADGKLINTIANKVMSE